MSAGGIVIDITVGIACLAPDSRALAGIGWPQALATCQKKSRDEFNYMWSHFPVYQDGVS
jgi:hypothetical protein